VAPGRPPNDADPGGACEEARGGVLEEPRRLRPPADAMNGEVRPSASTRPHCIPTTNPDPNLPRPPARGEPGPPVMVSVDMMQAIRSAAIWSSTVLPGPLEAPPVAFDFEQRGWPEMKSEDAGQNLATSLLPSRGSSGGVRFGMAGFIWSDPVGEGA
jgi:hypothetical protein